MRRALLLTLLCACSAAPTRRAPSVPPPALLRLFDQARFGGDGEALSQLWRELDLPPPAARGPEATRRVLVELRRRLTDADSQRLFDADSALLDGDAAAIPAAARDLRDLADAGAAEIAGAARVRLFGLCAGALRAAAAALGPDKAVTANRCLYAVSDRDPAAYFAADPAARPPDPPWTDLLARARVLSDTIPASSPWHAIATTYADGETTALDAAKDRMPPRLVLDGVPQAHGSVPYDRTPVLTVVPRFCTVDSLVIECEDEAQVKQVVREALAEDRRGRVTLLAHQATPWALVANAAAIAARAGATFVDLGVASSVSVDGAAVPRLGGLPCAAWTLREGPKPQVPRDVPRGLMYDPARAHLGLTLVVDRRGARLVGARGEISGTFQDALLDVRRAFPEEAGLLIWAENVTYGEVVVQIAAARGMFPALALAAARPGSR